MCGLSFSPERKDRGFQKNGSSLMMRFGLQKRNNVGLWSESNPQYEVMVEMETGG